MGRERYSPQEQEFYRRYLKSPQWEAKKKQRIAAAGHRCEFVTTHMVPGVGEQQVRCTRTRYLCVHHNTYERLGCEWNTDLDVYCWTHHMLEHLMWKKCNICGEPCLGYDALGEKWLAATLAQYGIDLDGGRVDWSALPVKEQLADQIDKTCMRCRGIMFKEDT